MTYTVHRVCSFFLVAVALCCSGCREQREVRDYSLPRNSPPRRPINVEEIKSRWDHFLVSIVLDDNKAWFFKLVGNEESIEKHRAAFESFIASIEVSGQQVPTWQLPEGWSQRESESEMRLATLVVPNSPDDLEIAVSALPYSGEWEVFLEANVGRWLRQLSRDPISAEVIKDMVQELPTKNGSAQTIHLAGVMEKSMPRNPHGGMLSSSPANREEPTSQNKESTELAYEVPDTWLAGRARGMRIAAFLLPEGGPQDEVVVTRFPIGKTEMGSVERNVNRWAGQVGLTVSKDQIDELTESIEIDGLSGTFVVLEGTANTPVSTAIHAAMVEREGSVWFFKMTGNADLLKEQQAAFRKFLASVRFL